MGNETVTPTRHKQTRTKNSYSLDFSNKPIDKVLPESNTLKLVPINSAYRTPRNKFINNLDAFDQYQLQNQSNQKGAPSRSSQNTAKLGSLVTVNDQLRKQLMKISNQLTLKLKKKKFHKKQVQISLVDKKQRQSLGKQLKNAYKQIDMYKKILFDLKDGISGVKIQNKVIQTQNKIALVDQQIQQIMDNIQSIKTIQNYQSDAINKQKSPLSISQLQQSKRDIQYLKNNLKQLNKQSRRRQKKYMQQHQYMFSLEDKIKSLQQEQLNQKIQQIKKIQQQKQQALTKQYQQQQKQADILKQKHDEYHKKINTLLIGNKSYKHIKKDLRNQIQQKNKQIQNLKYKRDALVKVLKDNLQLFAAKQLDNQQDLSQFQSEDEEEILPIQEQEEQRGTFDIDHLKDHKIKDKISEQKKKKKNQQKDNYHDPSRSIMKTEPKIWQKMVTRIVQRGKHKQQQITFTSGVKTPKSDMKIVMMHVWMNRKKQILSIQPIYLIDNIIHDGNKSSNNTQDEYKVTFNLDQFDYLKSILGIFGKEGFLEYLVLQSNFGKISKIGRGQAIGDNFAIGVAKEQTPVQIYGAYSFDGAYTRINKLQVQVLLDNSTN